MEFKKYNLKQNTRPKMPNAKKAFTLIEMLVVVFVVGVGLVGAISFFNVNINNQMEVKKELIAAGLAQEGLELVRNIRDYNIRNPEGDTKWYSNLIPASSCNQIDYRSLGDHLCEPGLISYDIIIYDYDRGRYRNLSTPPSGYETYTGYFRKIDVRGEGDLNDGGYLKVTCTVTWNNRKTEAVDYLYENSF